MITKGLKGVRRSQDNEAAKNGDPNAFARSRFFSADYSDRRTCGYAQAHNERTSIAPGSTPLTYANGICHMKVMAERHVKLFKNGRNQAVRIPREFELPGEDAIIRKEGQRLIIEAAPPRSLLAVLATLQTLDENFPPIEDPPAEPVDL